MGGRYLEQKPEAVSGELRVQAVQAHADLAKLKHRVEALVAEGKTVVFADNGDPMVFSPWSWAMQQFAQLQPVVIPGVSSFNAANAALQRGVTGSGSILLTSGDDANLTDKAGRLAGTVVFFTHQKKLEHLLPSLQARFPANTPAAVVCDVSYPNERVIRSTLGEIGKSIGQEKLPQLYLFYVGDGLQQIRCCPLTDSPAEIHPPKAG
jgi:precorrin-4 methylase